MVGRDPPAAEMCLLSQLEVGGKGEVVAVSGDPEVRRRLLEMGFCSGVQVETVRRAPLGDPIEFRVRGYHLSLRAEQARHVRVSRRP
jgi:Fe2+ transport system protein FeoA